MIRAPNVAAEYTAVCTVTGRSGVEMSAIVPIIRTAALNAHSWIHMCIVKRTVKTCLVSGSTVSYRWMSWLGIGFFFCICRHQIQLNLSTWLGMVKNSKIRYRPPRVSQQMEVTGTEKEYSGVTSYLLISSVGLCLLQPTSVLHLQLLTSRY